MIKLDSEIASNYILISEFLKRIIGNIVLKYTSIGSFKSLNVFVIMFSSSYSLNALIFSLPRSANIARVIAPHDHKSLFILIGMSGLLKF